MVAGFAKRVIRWRFFVIIAMLILVAMAGGGARLLEFTTDYRIFFSKENPQLRAFDALQNTYTKYDNMLFVLAPKDGEVFTQETLASVEWLTKAAWQIPYSIRVDSITNFQYTYAEGDDLVVEDLVIDPMSLSVSSLERVRQIAVSEPLLVNRLISPQTHVTGVNVTIQLPGIEPEMEVREVVAFTRDLADRVRTENPNLDVYLTGILLFTYLFVESSEHDAQTLVPAMFLIIVVTLGLLLQTFSGTFVTVLVVIFSVIATMGLTGWLGIPLTAVSAGAPIIIMTLAIADCVHILVNFLHGMRTGLDKGAAMKESIRINLQPIFLTSLTTAIGFVSMNFSDSPPFRDLGNIVAMGIGACFALSVTFLPALIMVLPVRVKTARPRAVWAMERVSEFVIEQRNRLLWGMAVVIILLIAFIPLNELNDEFLKYFDETVPFRVASDFANENLTGIYIIEYSLGAGEPGGISNPAFLQKVEEFAQWYRRQPKVLHVNTITDIMKRLNKNLHADDTSWYRIPDQRDLAAQYLLLYELSLPYGLDLNDQINVDKSATRFIVTLKSLSTNELLAQEKRAQDWLRKNAPPSMQVDGSGPSMMFAHMGARNIRSMLAGTTLALVLISFILVVVLRSVKIGLITMVPNLVPAGMAFGLWGLLVGQVNLSLSVVVGMTLGIVVDDTIHFLSKYLRARREQGKNPEDAVRYAFSTAGRALWITSLVLVAGFLVLSQSSFELNSGMGLLSAITIVLALVVDFLLLPPLLMLIEKAHPV